MLINLQNLQPMELGTDSTESTESREITECQQAEVDKYTKRIVELMIRDPCVSVPGILQQLKTGGLRSSEESVVHLFGGPELFRKTCRRMEILRWVLVTHQWEAMPFQMDIQYREWEGRRQYFIKPDSNDDWVSWWAPDMFSVRPFEPINEEEEEDGIGERRIYRFPAREDEDNYFKEVHSEEEGTNSGVEMIGAA